MLTQRALWIGQHALPLFFVMLALLLAASCAGWWALQRTTRLRRHNTRRPALVLGQRFALGCAVILAGAGIFAALARQLGAKDVLGRADQALTDALRVSVPQTALHLFAALTHLADTATLTGLCIVMAMALVVLGQRGLAVGWVVAVAGNGLLNQTLKQVFGRVRPLDPDGSAVASGFSFPSGHSSGSVVAYGMLAYLALRLLPARWHLPALVTAVVLAFTVGASRLFLRVHFASDVMAGFASGATWLALCITGIELLRWWRRRLSLPAAL
ncbi:phosphatase PAP2 family protein [Rhodoferax sp. UBA5149]|uniref:phosphatase PAP2 family protein n=1 Tax=Rhodoferax sp. UBA5149 TaxID=1947379 RepID=UPI0025EA8C0A|nr:phosphatase PAP2 family protein [Rhodoferax sp. UBA5149]